MKNKERREFGLRSLRANAERLELCITHALRAGYLLVLLFALSTVALGQDASSLQGTIVDELGAKIAGAEVRAKSRSGLESSSSTDAQGVFEFTNLSPGEYLIEIEAKGFAGFVSNEIILSRGESKRLSFTLKVAGISESVVVVAAGTLQREEEVSKVVSVVDDAQIERRREQTISEALRGTPGIRVQQQGSPGALTSIRLRGQRTFDTAILLDGLRVRDAADINGAASSLITDLSPVAMDRVEILRGAGSSIYGSSAIGGVVNLVPAMPGQGFHFELGAEAGGLGTFNESVKLSHGGNRAGFALGLSRSDVRHGIDGDGQYGNTAGAGRFQFNLSSSVRITGTVYGTLANARLNDSPLPLPAAFGTGSEFPRAVAGVNFQPDFNNPDQGRRNRLFVGSARLTQQLTEGLSYSVAYQRTSSHRRNYNGPLVQPGSAVVNPFGEFEFLSISRGTTDTLDARVNARLWQSNVVTAGLEFERESASQEFGPPHGTTLPPRDKQRTFAIFGQDQLSLLNDNLQLSIGVRGQFFRLSAADRPGALEALDTRTAITGDGSIAYFFDSTNTKIRAHVGNGFRAPSLYERFGFGTFGMFIRRFGDPTLKAEQSISVDGGFDQRLAEDRVLFGATYFYTRLQRTIVFTGLMPDPLGLRRVAGYANRSGGLARGVETFVEVFPARGTELRASYTFTNSDRAGVGGGLLPEYVIARHVFGFNFNQRYRAFAVNFDLNRTGAHIAPVFELDFPFRSAELTFGGHTKVDLYGSYEKKLSERWTTVLFAGADNIFNQRYFENGFLAPGVVGKAGVSLKF